MPSRWQREFTCDVCATRTTHLAGELRTPGRLGWAITWRICDSCLDRIFTWRGALSWQDLVETARIDKVENARQAQELKSLRVVKKAAQLIADLDRTKRHATCGRPCIWKRLLIALEACQRSEMRSFDVQP